MSRIILLVGYNNYFNRTLKKESTINEYISKSVWSYQFDSANFNINDGIYTEHTVNWPSHSTPDYLLVTDQDTISTRWFITEWTRTRGGQYIAKLRRDVVAEYIDSIAKSPCFIERGPLTADNKLIFNSEGFNLNRIKQEEILLKDETGKPWIVGYIDRKLVHTDDILSVFNEDQYPTAEALGINFNEGSSPSSGGYVKSIDTTSIMPEMKLIRRYGQTQGEEEIRVKVLMSAPNKVEDQYFYINGSWGPRQGRAKMAYNVSEELAAKSFWEVVKDPSNEVAAFELYNNLMSGLESTRPYWTIMPNIDVIRQNPIIYHGGKYYRITVVSDRTTEYYQDVTRTGNMTGAFYSMEYFFDKWRRKPGIVLENDTIVGEPYDVGWKEAELELTFTEVTPPDVSRVHLSSDRNHLDDAPYDMFCMEYDLSNLALAQSIALELTSGSSGSVKDLQIVPYCPARFILQTGALTEGRDYSPILQGPDHSSREVGRMYYCKHSSDTITINTPIPIKFRDPDQAINTKLSNECDMYRLSSPNYASSFEFSVAKNGGVESFKVTFTYRPISPYIHVQPIFKGLYGNVNNDARGLICGGDFSVDMLSDAFFNYQVNNKNYENIFNTQIKRMDELQGINRINAGVGIGVGALQAAGTGAAMGAAGGVAGAVIGGIAGAAASIGGGIADYALQEQAYGINRQYSVDMYNYTLGNIQALPNTLTKISAYNIDNKYFPLIEVYTCTEEEVEIIKTKFKYQSFVVMGLMTINDLTNEQLTGKFIKGQMVRLLDFYEDEHAANEIYSEIAKGVYI